VSQEQAKPISSLENYIQGVNGNGECCMAYCIDGSYRYLIGNKEKTSGCADWAAAACGRRGYPYYDAFWGSCNTWGVTWL
jgi:hypothetical protein